MSYGFIDSASVIGAIGTLATYDTRQDWGEWTYQSVLEVTTALVFHDGFRIALGPSIPTQSGSVTGVSKLYQCYGSKDTKRV